MAKATDLEASMLGVGSPPSSSEAGPPETEYDHGELAPFPASPYPALELSDGARKAIKALCDLIGNKDIAARRWEVEQSWEARLFDRGYQYLLPRRGGGWILPPFATDYNRASGNGSRKFYGYETNIYATYGEIITAALTRDIPQVRFEPSDPESDADITAAHAATQYARVFARNNDLFDLHQQLVYYLRTDGRAIIAVDHVLDAQRFGRCDDEAASGVPVVPETETMATGEPVLYLVRHGETEMNSSGQARGRSEVTLDDKGERQVQRSADWLKRKGIKAITTSPVERAAESAQILSQTLGVRPEVDDRLASLDIGTFSGENSGDVHDDISEAFQNPDAPIGDTGETPDQFTQRVQAVLFDAIRGPNLPMAVVTHDSVISEAFKIFHGEGVPAGSVVGPGGVAAVYQQPDGTYTVCATFPYAPPPPSSGQSRGAPRGMEIAEPFGKLEAKVPINAQRLSDCPFVQISREYDFAYVKAMFPEHADKIVPGQAGAGENELDRIARINAMLALEASYVTGDSMVRDCTLQRTWIRPGFFMEVKDKDVRAELLQNCPDGCLVIYAGDCQVLVRNENMDEHLTMVQCYPGSGMNRLALCSKLLSIQKRVNNWIDLLNDYYIRCIPQRYIDSDVFNVEAIGQQTAVPGSYVPYSGDVMANRAPNPAGMAPIWVEPTPTHQPSMPTVIMTFLNELPQLLSGALPSLFGSPSNTDTVGGIAIQRDQALARLGTPWHSIQQATCSYFRQAVQLAARCRTEDVKGMVGGHAVRVELADMRGDILAFPENEANFPETWNQKQQRYQALLGEANSNPHVAALISAPVNQKFAADMAGMTGFKNPVAVSYEKQMGEFDLLLQGAPIPNPDYDQLAQHIQQMQAGLQQQMQMGIPDPDMQQQIDQAVQQLQGMPEMLPSVPIDPETDDNATEAAACLDLINSPDGRRLRNGTPEEKLHFQNLKLHWQAHHSADAKTAAKSGKMPKPLSITANLKDLPPAAAAEVLQDSGLSSDPVQVAQGREMNAAIKKTSKVEPETA